VTQLSNKKLLSGTEVAICAGLGIMVGLSSISRDPGGGIYNLVGRLIGSWFGFILIALLIKAIWKSAVFLLRRVRRV
jgi:hypothetical protein